MEEVMNGYIQIKPVQKGLISTDEGNEFEIVNANKYDVSVGNDGDIVIIESAFVIKVTVNNQEEFYVKAENVLKVIRQDGSG